MICPICKKESELKKFNTFQFYYCKFCKKEVELKEAPKWVKKPKSEQETLENIFMKLLEENDDKDL